MFHIYLKIVHPRTPKPQPKTKPDTPSPPAPTPAEKTTPAWMHDFCVGKKMGNHPDPTRCDGFITCVGYIAIRRDCPAKLWYNAKTDRCDYPQNVDCSCMFLFISSLGLTFIFDCTLRHEDSVLCGIVPLI